MATRQQYVDLVRIALGGSIALTVVLAALSTASGSGLVLFVDLLFVCSVGLFAIAAVLTRPSVLRRRKIRRAERELADESDDGSDRDDPTGSHTEASLSRDSLFWGLVCAIVATVLFCLMLLVQYG